MMEFTFILITIVIINSIANVKSSELLSDSFEGVFREELKLQGGQGEDLLLGKEGTYMFYSELFYGIKIYEISKNSMGSIIGFNLVAKKEFQFETTGLALSNDENFIFVVLNGQGVMALSIKDQQNWSHSSPFELSVVAQFVSAELPLKSVLVDSDDAFLYFANGGVGIFIFDILIKNSWNSNNPTVLMPVAQKLPTIPIEFAQDEYYWICLLKDSQYLVTSGNQQIQIYSVNEKLTWNDPNNIKLLPLLAKWHTTSKVQAVVVSLDDLYLYASLEGTGIVGFSLAKREQWSSITETFLIPIIYLPELQKIYFIKLLTVDTLFYTIKEQGVQIVQLKFQEYSETDQPVGAPGIMVNNEKNTARFAFSFDQKRIFIANEGITVINLTSDLTASDRNSLLQFNTPSTIQVVGSTPFGDASSFQIFGPGYVFYNYGSSFNLIDMTDGQNNLVFDTQIPPYYPILSQSDDVDSFICSDIDVSNDQKYLLVANQDKRVLLIDISDQGSWNSNLKAKIIANFQFPTIKTDLVYFSPDDKYAFIFQSDVGIKVFDISDKTGWDTSLKPNIQTTTLVAQSSASIGTSYEGKNVAFSQGGEFIYVATSQVNAVQVFDLRDQSGWLKGSITPANLKMIGKWHRTDGMVGANRVALTPDNMYLLVAESNRLVIFITKQVENSNSLVNMTQVVIATELIGNLNNKVTDVVVSSDNKFAFIAILDVGVLIADIGDQSNWTGEAEIKLIIKGSISTNFRYYFVKSEYLQLFNDDKFLMVGNRGQGGIVVSLYRDTFLKLNAEDNFFELGKPQTINFVPHRFNPNLEVNDYFPEVEDFKILSISEQYLDQQGQTLSKSPSWTTILDKSGHIYMPFENKESVGIHTLSLKLTYQIPNHSFIGIKYMGVIADSANSKLIWYFTNMWGYIDNLGYIAEDFDKNEPMTFINYFQNYDEQFEARKIITSFISQYDCQIIIHKSLNITEIPKARSNIQTSNNSIEENNLKSISISTLSTLPVTLTVEFTDVSPDTIWIKQISTVLNIQYLNNGQKAVLKGKQRDINDALSHMRFSGPYDQGNLAGIVTVDDQLNQVLIQQYSNFQEYLVNNAPPKFQNSSSLMTQFSKKIKNFKAGLKFFFEIDPVPFSDPDDSLITLQIQNITKVVAGKKEILKELPNWLNFNSELLIFSGTPNEIDCIIEITMECTDGYKSAYDNLILDLRMDDPSVSSDPFYRTEGLIKQALESGDAFLQIGRLFSFSLSKKSYKDFDELAFKAFISNSESEQTKRRGRSRDLASGSEFFENISERRINSASENGSWIELSTRNSEQWMKFDASTQRLYGVPTKDDLHEFELKIVSSNGFQQSSDIFKLEITNQPPILAKPLSEQFRGVKAPINEILILQFDPDTFKDPDNDNLTYSIRIEGYNQLPGWVKFRESDRQIEIISPRFRSIRLILEASDPSDSLVIDKLQVSVIFTALYIFNLFIYVGGPLVSALGLIRYRALIFNILFSQLYQWNQIHYVKVGSEFQIKIPLIKKEFEIASKIWKDYCKKHKGNQWFIQEICEDFQISQDKLFQALNEEYQMDSNVLRELEMSTVKELIFGLALVKVFQYDRDLQSAYDRLVESTIFKTGSVLDWYHEFVDVQPNEIEGNVLLITEKEQILKDCVEKMEFQGRFTDNNYVRQIFFSRIRAHALGSEESKFLRDSYGETLRVDKEEVQKIRALISERKKSCSVVMDVFKEQFFELGESEYLPHWMTVEFDNSNLIIKGMPVEHDHRIITISIQNIQGFRLRTLKIMIEQENSDLILINEQILKEEEQEEIDSFVPVYVASSSPKNPSVLILDSESISRLSSFNSLKQAQLPQTKPLPNRVRRKTKK